MDMVVFYSNVTFHGSVTVKKGLLVNGSGTFDCNLDVHGSVTVYDTLTVQACTRTAKQTS